MQLTGQIGPQTASDGAPLPLRQGRTAEAVVTELHGKYFEQTLRGNVFTWAAAAAVLNTAGTTASTVLVNPAGNSKNLSLIRIEVSVTALAGTPVVGTYNTYINSNTVAAAVTGTAGVAQSSLIGSNFQPQGKVFTAATLPAAPTLFRPLANKETGAATTIPYLQTFVLEFDGTCVLTPGTAISVQQNTADTTNATAAVTYIWEEI